MRSSWLANGHLICFLIHSFPLALYAGEGVDDLSLRLAINTSMCSSKLLGLGHGSAGNSASLLPLAVTIDFIDRHSVA